MQSTEQISTQAVMGVCRKVFSRCGSFVILIFCFCLFLYSTMAFMDENTSLIRMKRDFDHFVQDQSRNAGLSAFSLDENTENSFKNTSNDSGAISVQALLGLFFPTGLDKQKRFSVKL